MQRHKPKCPNALLDEYIWQDLSPNSCMLRPADPISCTETSCESENQTYFYLQICHNIYRIKTCMDIGKPVILLNLDELYESLYDALNQYFSSWGDRKFVDLGLGTHRVKAFVNDNFRFVCAEAIFELYVKRSAACTSVFG